MPSHHRAHHGSNPEYLDKNYANFLIIWDWLFGTFEPEREKVVYGHTENIHTCNPLKITFHEWIVMAKDVKRAGSLSDARRYLINPSGWHPVPSREGALETQARPVGE